MKFAIVVTTMQTDKSKVFDVMLHNPDNSDLHSTISCINEDKAMKLKQKI